MVLGMYIVLAIYISSCFPFFPHLFNFLNELFGPGKPYRRQNIEMNSINLINKHNGFHVAQKSCLQIVPLILLELAQFYKPTALFIASEKIQVLL